MPASHAFFYAKCPSKNILQVGRSAVCFPKYKYKYFTTRSAHPVRPNINFRVYDIVVRFAKWRSDEIYFRLDLLLVKSRSRKALQSGRHYKTILHCWLLHTHYKLIGYVQPFGEKIAKNSNKID